MIGSDFCGDGSARFASPIANHVGIAARRRSIVAHLLAS